MMDTSTIGYSWSGNTISSLFQPYALNGSENTSRFFAITSALFYCLSLSFVFVTIAKNSASLLHQSIIKTAGIGSMVYAFLIVTPMHNLMVNIALAFYVVAVFTLLHSLYVLKLRGLVVFGVCCIALPLFNAVLYYFDVLSALLPAIQKLGLFACVIWFLVIYYFQSSTSKKVINQA
ncbi:hypothetical protein ACOYR1_10505 [Thalassotalea piscium]